MGPDQPRLYSSVKQLHIQPPQDELIERLTAPKSSTPNKETSDPSKTGTDQHINIEYTEYRESIESRNPGKFSETESLTEAIKQTEPA